MLAPAADVSDQSPSRRRSDQRTRPSPSVCFTTMRLIVLPSLLFFVVMATSFEDSVPRNVHEDSPAVDLVIAGGRVMDPESSLDAVRNVGIREGKVVEISERPLSG